MTRIVLIGGGSPTWGPTFVRDLLATPELAGSTIVLHDLAPERLDRVHALGTRLITAFGLDFHLEKTLVLPEALTGADVVVLTITTGGLDAMRADLEIPARYDIRQSVGDTTGPGGLSRALRNIPVVSEIGRQVMAHCPRALFLFYTNPLSVLTRVLALQGVRVVGLCHEWHGVRAHLATLFDVPPEQVRARIAGINHLVWVTDLYAGRRRVWTELPAIAEEILHGRIAVDADGASVFADHAKVKATLLRTYGALPAAGDRHIAEFFPHFITANADWGRAYDLRLTSLEDRRQLERDAWASIEAALRGETNLAEFMRDVSGEAASQITRAWAGGAPYAGIMNLPNVGQVGNLPRDAIVETLGVVDVTGAHGLAFGDLPDGVQSVLEHHVRQQELTVRAALAGSRTLALQVLLNDPLSSPLSVTQAEHLLEELLEANRSFLPRFFGP